MNNFVFSLQITEGVIGPFSSVKLELVWQPTIPGTVNTEFSIVFDDPNSEKVISVL